uniref:Chemosensory protein 3 n=1 Tax=Apocheima cinerarius TaxID=706528 RepID=A0A8T9EUB7_APOCI|nr:chemosensory protein 3 [Apocheima cinerarius]
MKSWFIFALALVAACSAETYTTENDDLDIAAVVANLQTLKEFVDCFNDKGNCNPQSGDFKKDMAEAIQQACAKCTDAQKHIFKVFLDGLKQKLPAENEVYRKKYDPDNKYFGPLEAAIINA